MTAMTHMRMPRHQIMVPTQATRLVIYLQLIIYAQIGSHLLIKHLCSAPALSIGRYQRDATGRGLATNGSTCRSTRDCLDTPCGSLELRNFPGGVWKRGDCTAFEVHVLHRSPTHMCTHCRSQILPRNSKNGLRIHR